jgi:hypothetical protein
MNWQQIEMVVKAEAEEETQLTGVPLLSTGGLRLAKQQQKPL